MDSNKLTGWTLFFVFLILLIQLFVLGSHHWTQEKVQTGLKEQKKIYEEQLLLRQKVQELELLLQDGVQLNKSSKDKENYIEGFTYPKAPSWHYESKPKKGKYVEAWQSDSENLNPITSSDASASDLETMIFNSMISYHPDTLDPIPELAKGWKVSEDKLRITFHLKNNIKWSDGQPFTADDVIFTFNVMMNTRVNAPHIQSYFNNFAGIKKISDELVEVTWKIKYFKMFSMVGSQSIFPAHYYREKYGIEDETSQAFADRFNEDNDLAEVSTGNYLFDKRERGRSVTLKRNPFSWEKGLGNFDEVQFVVFTDRTAMLQELINQGIDTMELYVQEYIDYKDKDSIKNQYVIKEFLEPSYYYCGYNQRRDQFKSKKVRQALTMLMDRKSIVQNLIYNKGQVINGPFYSGSEFLDPQIENFTHNPKKALELLAEEGWKVRDSSGLLTNDQGEPLTIKIITNKNNTERELITKIFDEALKNVGIQSSYQYLDWSILLKRVEQRDFDAVVLGWRMGLLDPDPFQIWHSSMMKEGGSNHVGFKLQRADEIIMENRETFDKKRRIELCRELHRIIHEEQPYTFIYSKKTFQPVAQKFKNVKLHQGGVWNMEWHY